MLYSVHYTAAPSCYEKLNTNTDEDSASSQSSQYTNQAKGSEPTGKNTERTFFVLVLALAVALVLLLNHLIVSKQLISERIQTTTVSTPSDSQEGDESENKARLETQEDSASDSRPTTLTDNIVENFEFSAIEETPSPAVQEQAPYFCLNKTPLEQTAVTTDEACRKISNRLASVSLKSCQSANLISSQCGSVSGFPILYSEFPPVEKRKPQGRILVIGGTHGDELTSVSITFRWIEKLNKYHSGLFHWHIAPMMNPDGVLQKEAQRTNSNGIDLNRNLPSIDWHENALKYWREKQSENPRRYPGEKPASEPEAQWLIDEINHFKPDAIISVHAPYGVVDFDSLLLNTAPKSLGKLHLNLLGTYPGSLGNYAGINRGIPVITLELPHAWVMPSEEETTKIWEDIVSWLRKNVGENASSQLSQSNAAR